MNYVQCAIIVAVLGGAQSYSKFGRKCSDIGCLSNEICVMKSEPCSYYTRDNNCGDYPTCERTTNSGPTCATFTCPPGTTCRTENGNPKCVQSESDVGRHVQYELHRPDAEEPNRPAQNPRPNAPVPNAPPQEPPSGGLYPTIKKGTTPRPRVNHGYQPAGSGYQGGQIGSGYPGQGQRYPQNGYQQPGAAAYPYPQNNGQRYPQNGQQNPGYPNPGYQGQYPYNQPGYQNPYGNQNRYGQKSEASNPIYDKLKQYGFFILITFYVTSGMFAV